MLRKRFFSIVTALLMTFMASGCSLLSILSSSSSSEESSLEEKEMLVDYIVEVEEGRDPVVLQLTDTQIIDASQQRTEDRLGGALASYWAKDKKEERCYRYLRQIIGRSNPDLIILTGDIVYGEFDDDGSALSEFVQFMESFNIPWAPIFGNHENESKMGVDWQCEQFENAKNCLFKRRELTGNGNYTVGIKQGERLLRVFYMLDSNGCGSPSIESSATQRIRTASGFGTDQIEWYENSMARLKEESPNTRISMAFHIPIEAFITAFTEKYDYNALEFTPIDLDKVGVDGDFGYIGVKFSGWDKSYTVWKTALKYGVDSMFVGHDHAISAGVKYGNIHLQFGQKSTTYDSLNYINSQGKIESSYSEIGKPIVGGTVIPVSKLDGTISPYNMLYIEK